MALIFRGKSECKICGKILEPGQEILTLPPISNISHPLWEYFDSGFHESCYANWHNKEEAEQLIQLEQKK